MDRNRMRLGLAVTVIAVALIGTGATQAASAAEKPAAITRRVLTNGGEPVVGATVQAKSATGTIYTTTSRTGGRFAVTGLKPGKYSLKFSDRVGLFPCPESSCSDSFNDHFVTEWLGDVSTFADAEKITLSAGEKHTGVRALFDHYARISGRVTVDGRAGSFDDDVIVDTYRNGKKVGAQLTSSRWFEEISRAGNYRFRVSSDTDAFAAYWITDPRDGNTTFHIDLIEKIIGVKIDVTTAA